MRKKFDVFKWLPDHGLCRHHTVAKKFIFMVSTRRTGLSRVCYRGMEGVPP